MLDLFHRELSSDGIERGTEGPSLAVERMAVHTAPALEDRGAGRETRRGDHHLLTTGEALGTVLGRPVVVVYLTHPGEEGDQPVDLTLREALVGHLAPRRGKSLFRARHPEPEALCPDAPDHLGEIRGIVPAEPQDRVAVIAVVLLKDPLPRDHLRGQLVRVRQHLDLTMRVPGEPQEQQRGRDGPDNKDPKSDFL